MSEKREKFVKLAESRVNKTLKDVQLIGNLSNRSAYEYSDEDIRKIFKALQESLDKAKQRFADAGTASRGTFRL